MFPIRQVPLHAAQSTEPLGTKFKFWFVDPDLGLTLFKEGRPGTGENWAEKIACELAVLIGMPHAAYDLAQCGDRNGTVSRTLVNEGARVVHGNEILTAYVTDYVTREEMRYRNPGHTLRRVIAYFRASESLVGAPYGWPQSVNIRTTLDFFIGYLMFDAWIANQDRHDENWGILRMNDGNLFLSPSYDHGSSMARNESDKKRAFRLTTRDRMQHISTFILKASSGLFPTTSDLNPPPLTTLEAFIQAAAYSPHAASEWCERLARVSLDEVAALVDQVPNEWMSPTAKQFTAELLRLNRERILNTELK